MASMINNLGLKDRLATDQDEAAAYYNNGNMNTLPSNTIELLDMPKNIIGRSSPRMDVGLAPMSLPRHYRQSSLNYGTQRQLGRRKYDY